jgi:hypothetical protein
MKIEKTIPEWKKITNEMKESFKDFKWIDSKLDSLESSFKKLEKMVRQLEKKRCGK